MNSIVSIKNLGKIYDGGFEALKNINLEIRRGEILALLGPNGAGKTTLISIICGIVNATSGTVTVDGKDIVTDYRATRSLIGLVPQELTTDAFEKVWSTVAFSRGLFGKPSNPQYLEELLKELSLWEKKDNKLMTLSGGMKRRVMIAKALSHEPSLLFLDEPTAGVDVELRKGMWNQVRSLQQSGVTVVLTTHYIDEAEEMADRIGVINDGELILTESKADLMKKLGTKQLAIELKERMVEVPAEFSEFDLRLENSGEQLIYTYDSSKEDHRISALLETLKNQGVLFKDLSTSQSSLEEIFVNLVKNR